MCISLIASKFHSFMHSWVNLLIGCPLCTRHCCRHWTDSSEQNRPISLPLRKLPSHEHFPVLSVLWKPCDSVTVGAGHLGNFHVSVQPSTAGASPIHLSAGDKVKTSFTSFHPHRPHPALWTSSPCSFWHWLPFLGRRKAGRAGGKGGLANAQGLWYQGRHSCPANRPTPTLEDHHSCRLRNSRKLQHPFQMKAGWLWEKMSACRATRGLASPGWTHICPTWMQIGRSLIS